MKVKISHEAPLSLMEYVKPYNDYDYCLPHLLDEELKYLEYFLKSKDEGRCIIMDNSLHELGTSFNIEQLIHWIKVLEPDYFFIPDVWEDRTNSIINARKWLDIELPKKTKKLAIVQGSDFNEAVLCAEIYRSLGYYDMAFSYGASWYNEMIFHPNPDLGKALGRLTLITHLYINKTITKNNYIHLLGASVPQEFNWYKNIECIKSIDTSNPVMAALGGIKYTESGLFKKPISNINNSFYVKEENVDFNILKYNLEMFRKINNL